MIKVTFAWILNEILYESVYRHINGIVTIHFLWTLPGEKDTSVILPFWLQTSLLPKHKWPSNNGKFSTTFSKVFILTKLIHVHNKLYIGD